MKKPISVKQARKLLPKETDGLMDSQIRGMLEKIGDVETKGLKAEWKKHLDRHAMEWATFLYDMYQESKRRKSESPEVLTKE